MKKLNTLMLFLLITSYANSQNFTCYKDSIVDFNSKLDSSYLTKFKNMMIRQVQESKNINKGEIKQYSSKRATAPNMVNYIIPVVVHIVHKSSDNVIGVGSNISVAQVQNQIYFLNKYFRPYNIAFCLATKKPDGTSFNGITRQSHALTNYRLNTDFPDLAAISEFPQDQYLNIYVVNSILNEYGTPGYSGGAAYTGSDKLGVSVTYQNFGHYDSCTGCNLFTSSRAKVLVHEMGHIFGLIHPQDGGCSGMDTTNCDKDGDYICDTPPMEFRDYQCTTSNTCNEYNDKPDPIHNYMGYKPETCIDTFTPLQLQKMYYHIETYFANNISVDNILKTTSNGCNYITALFTTDKYQLCEPGIVKLKALDTLNEYQWKFVNHSQNNLMYISSKSSNNYLDFNIIDYGTYSVTLTVFSGSYSISRTMSNLIRVDSCGSMIKSARGNWYFGEYAGLQFKQKATLINDKAYFAFPEKTINSLEGCIVQNNKKGELLFYGGGKSNGSSSDSFYLYDKTHRAMPNGTLFGASTSRSGGITIPVPNNGKRFYLFTTNRDNDNKNEANLYGLRYSIIDTSLNSGNGDVVSGYKNIPVKAPLNRHYSKYDSAVITGEGIAAIPGCDSSYYYIIVASLGDKTDSLFGKSIEVYKVTSSSVTHHSQVWLNENFKANGQIVSNVQGNMVCIAGVLFEFDRQIGKLKLLKKLVDEGNVRYDHIYLNTFSPNGNLLYVIKKNQLISGEFINELRQYDLTNLNSYTKLKLKENAYVMQYAPDNKMYISQFDDPKISVIDKPNEINDFQNQNTINYKLDDMPLKLGLAKMLSKGGLPNFIDATPQKELIPKLYHRFESCNQVYFYTSQCCKTNYKWNFGDNQIAYGKTALHSYSGKTGTYYVTLTIDSIDVYHDTIVFGITGTTIGGSNTTCDTNNYSPFYVKNANVKKYQYKFSAINGSAFQYPNSFTADVKWHKDSGKVIVVANDKYGCKDTGLLNFKFNKLIHNNIISTNHGCDTSSITGSLPSGGNDTFDYVWQISDNGRNWSIINNVKTQSYYPTNINGKKFIQRLVMSDDCISYSNIVEYITLNSNNRIEEYYLPNDYNQCYTRLKGTSILKYFPTATIQWLESEDSITWTSLPGANSDTLTNNLNRNWFSKYFKRVVTFGSCTSTSNVYHYRVLDKPLQEIKFCDSFSFPYTLSYKIKADFLITLQYKHKGLGSQYWVNYMDQNHFKNQFIVSQNPFDSIKVTDSFRYLITPIGCQDFINSMYSNIEVPNKQDSFLLLEQPVNKTINYGETAGFKVKVNNPNKCKFTWQTSMSQNGPWSNVLNSNFDSITLFSNSCGDSMYVRVKIEHPCTTLFSDTVKFIIKNYSILQSDYWMKDDKHDRGKEPNNISTSFVVSEDIWIRNYNDGKLQHQELNTMLDTNWVNVTIRNRQNNPISGAKLRLYWTWGSTSETWTRNWTKNDSNYIKKGNNDSFLMGSEINFVDIDLPPISRNQFYKVVYPWTNFPREGWYDLSNTFNTEKINVCLLARIITCNNAPYGMTFAEGRDVIKNIKNNNNIISRNIWTREFQIPNNENDNKYKDNELVKFNPNLNDGGVILVGSSSDDSTTNDVCVDTEDSLFFTKAEAYVKLPQKLYDIWKTSSNSLTGMLYVKDNCFKITNSHACLNAINFPTNDLYPVAYYYGYTDVNNRFTNNEVFKVSINQKDENDEVTGECIYMIRDNPFVNVYKEVIETNTTYSICYWEEDSSYNDSIIYNVSHSLPYKIYKDGNEIMLNPYHQYGFKEGEYMIVATDVANNTEYIDNVYVMNDGISVNETTTPIVFPCDSPYYEYETFDNTHIVYDLYNNIQTPTSGNTYLLDGTNTIYYDIKNNYNACTVDKIKIAFDDIPVFPSTPTANLMAQYNLELDTCCFIKVNDLNCYGMPLAQGQNLDVYDMALNYQFTVTIQSYSDTTMGFRFCPPQWDTTAENINDQYKMVYKSSTCEYCRIDFACDNRVIFENVTNVSDIKINDIHIYPNPAQNSVNVFIKNKMSLAHVIVYDQLGKQVMNQEIKDSNFSTLNVSELVSGVYTIFIPELNYNYKLVLIK